MSSCDPKNSRFEFKFVPGTSCVGQLQRETKRTLHDFLASHQKSPVNSSLASQSHGTPSTNQPCSSVISALPRPSQPDYQPVIRVQCEIPKVLGNVTILPMGLKSTPVPGPFSQNILSTLNPEMSGEI